MNSITFVKKSNHALGSQVEVIGCDRMENSRVSTWQRTLTRHAYDV